MKVLLLGADGFIGRHIAFHLRALGHEVLAQARNPGRLAAMGFATLRADLTDPATHDPAFWAPHRPAGAALVVAAGLLTGSDAAFRAVHVAAPGAAMAAGDGPVVLVSAAGIDDADTGFARWRRAAEDMAAGHGATILRPGLVLAETSYGGSSLIRALAALPVATPVVGDGTQRFDPIHAADLAAVVAACLAAPTPGTFGAGGPEVVTQTALIAATRGWLGLPQRPALHLPLPLARALGGIGDALRLGPVSATSVAQLQAGVLTDRPAHPATAAARPLAVWLNARPAGTQDLWQARLYLMKPLVRLVLALIWLASAALGLLTPLSTFAPAVATLPENLALVLARGGGLVDLALGLALLRNIRPRAVALAQLAVVAGYTIGLTALAPALWLDPFGGLLKNLAVLALILIHLVLTEER